jgi:hypothetical protein
VRGGAFDGTYILSVENDYGLESTTQSRWGYMLLGSDGVQVGDITPRYHNNDSIYEIYEITTTKTKKSTFRYSYSTQLQLRVYGTIDESLSYSVDVNNVEYEKKASGSATISVSGSYTYLTFVLGTLSDFIPEPTELGLQVPLKIELNIS